MKRASFLIVIIGVLGYAAAEMDDDMKEMILMLHNSCRDESGVAEDVITAAKNNDIKDDGTLKCYMKCLLGQMGGMDDNGDIDVEAILSVMPPEMAADVEPFVRKCGTQKGADACDTAWLTNKCWLKEGGPTKYTLI